MADDGQKMEMLLNKVSALEAELKEVKGVLAQVLALVTAMQPQARDSSITGPSPLLELPVEVRLNDYMSRACHRKAKARSLITIICRFCSASCTSLMTAHSTMPPRRAQRCTTHQVSCPVLTPCASKHVCAHSMSVVQGAT